MVNLIDAADETVQISWKTSVTGTPETSQLLAKRSTNLKRSLDESDFLILGVTIRMCYFLYCVSSSFPG